MSATIDASVWLAAISAAEPGYVASLAALRAIARAGLTMHQPALFLVEIAAAVARRTRDAQRALDVAKTARAEPRIVLHEIDDALTADAVHLAAHCALRGADAIYVATARATSSTLITLDTEILERAGRLVRVTDPATWLQEHQQTGPG